MSKHSLYSPSHFPFLVHMSYSRDTEDTIIYDLEDWENFVATEKDSFVNRFIYKDFPAFLSGVIERYESGIVDYPIEANYFEDALYEIEDYIELIKD